MPSSELPHSSSHGPEPTPSASPGSVRNFLVAVGVVVIFSLCVMAALNWLENPFGSFRPPHASRVNDRQSLAFRSSDRAQQMRWLLHQQPEPGHDTLLLGTSQALYGIDTCAFPGMQRIALYELNDREISQFLTAAGPHFQPPTTLLLQQSLVSRKEEATPASSSLQVLLHDLLDQQTTQISVANLTASLEARQPPCAAVDYDFSPGPSELSPGHVRAALQQQASSSTELDGVSKMLSSLTPLCDTLRPSVAVFTLPTYFTPDLRPELLSIFERNAANSRQTIQSFQQHTPGCRIVFVDLATSYLQQHPQGAPPADWYDLKHFKPALGDQLLQTIVAAAR